MNPPDTDDLPPPVEPSRPPEEAPVEVGPLPHGFVLTVKVGPGTRTSTPASISRYRDVATALGACWTPPSLDWGSATLRVAFRRDGTVYGLPRIPYVDAGTDDARRSIVRSLTAALESCTPLPFSRSLGDAIAGEIFAIRFINQDRSP